jgi:hypothetical protein
MDLKVSFSYFRQFPREIKGCFEKLITVLCGEKSWELLISTYNIVNKAVQRIS